MRMRMRERENERGRMRMKWRMREEEMLGRDALPCVAARVLRKSKRVGTHCHASQQNAWPCVAAANFHDLVKYWRPAPREDPPRATVLLGAGRGSDQRKLPQPAPNHRSRGWPEQVPDRVVEFPMGKAPGQQEFGVGASADGVGRFEGAGHGLFVYDSWMD